MKIPKSSSQNHHAELMHPYIKLVRLNKGIVNDMTTFKQTRKRLNELQLKINEKHRKIRHGEEELEINEELRQLYAEFFENSKREQDLIIAILADLSQLVEKAEERQKEETNSLAQQQQQQQVETQVQTTTPTPIISSSEQIIVPTSAVSSPSSSSSVPVKDPMQVDEDEETINSQASNSTTQNTSDSEKQTTKARTATGSKGGRNKKGGKSVKEPASSSERKVEASQPITSDKYLQIEEGIPVKSKVAARISGATEESGDSGFWILASILKYYPDKNRYDVIDEDNSDDEESTSTDRKTYKLNKNHIVQLPTDMSQHKLFKKGDKVFAVFPDTTTFYPAIVDTVPTKTSKNYSLKFEDDEEDGKTPTRKVSFKYVMSVPK